MRKAPIGPGLKLSHLDDFGQLLSLPDTIAKQLLTVHLPFVIDLNVHLPRKAYTPMQLRSPVGDKIPPYLRHWIWPCMHSGEHLPGSVSYAHAAL